MIEKVRAHSALIIALWRSKLTGLLLVVLSLLVIALVVRANRQALYTADWQLQPAYFLLSLLLIAATFAMTALTWHVIVVRFFPQTTLPLNARYWAHANLARRVPGNVWYIASRAALYEQQGISKAAISMLSGFEIAVILISGVILFLTTLPFAAANEGLLSDWSQYLLLIVLMPIALLLLHPRTINAIWRRIQKQSPLRQLAWRDTIVVTGLYLIVWLIGSAAFYTLIRALTPIDASSAPALINIWALANTLSFAGSLTIFAFGVRDISLVLLLTPFVGAQIGLIVAIAIRILWIGAELLGGLVALLLDSA